MRYPLLILSCSILVSCSNQGAPQEPPTIEAPPIPYPADPLPDVALHGVRIRIPILMYHRIAEPTSSTTAEQRRYIIRPDELRAQLAWLRDEGYDILSLAHFDRIVKGLPTAVPAKPIVLTFDDGYRDNVRNALPILEEFDAPATFFVYLWAVEQRPRDTDRGFASWEELTELVTAGMDIGSHSMSHGFLADLEPEKIRWEVQESRRILRENLGIEAQFFSYPYSSVNDRVREEVRDAGYALGLKALGGPDHMIGEGFLDVPRVEAPPDLERFQARVRWEQWAAPTRPGSAYDPSMILGDAH